VVKRIHTPGAGDWLIRAISKEEVKKAVFQMHAEKAPGPDGLTTGFFQENWCFVGGGNY